MQKMNLNLCAIALLLFGSLSVAHSRPSSSADLDDNNEVDNSIQTEPESSSSSSSSNKHRNRGNPFEDEWLKFTKTPPTTMHQAPGSTVAIVCEFMGSQVPTIEWIVGQMPRSEIDNLESNTVSEFAPTAIVRVRSVHIIDHMLSESRIYTCIGRTGNKIMYASTTVHPLDQGRDQRQGGLIREERQYQGDQSPRIIYTEKTHLDLMGSLLLLPCKVHARPHAKITWRNSEDKEIVQGDHFKVLPTGSLMISNLKWEDMGNYKCIAQNRAGSDSADTFVYPVLKEQD